MLIVFNSRVHHFHNHKFIRLERAGKLPKGQGIEETRKIELTKCGMSLLKQVFQLITSMQSFKHQRSPEKPQGWRKAPTLPSSSPSSSSQSSSSSSTPSSSPAPSAKLVFLKRVLLVGTFSKMDNTQITRAWQNPGSQWQNHQQRRRQHIGREVPEHHSRTTQLLSTTKIDCPCINGHGRPFILAQALPYYVSQPSLPDFASIIVSLSCCEEEPCHQRVQLCPAMSSHFNSSPLPLDRSTRTPRRHTGNVRRHDF